MNPDIQTPSPDDRRRSVARLLATALMLMLLLAAGAPQAQAAQPEDDGRRQRIAGALTGPGDLDVYRVADLRAGDTLHLLMQTQSGDLDPLLMVLDGDLDVAGALADYLIRTEQLLATSDNVAADINALRDEFTLAWDDDSGPGYAAALQFEAPRDGSYIVLAAGALSSVGRTTFGTYELQLGLNAPVGLEVGSAPATDTIAVLDRDALPPPAAVQETTGSLTASQATATHALSTVPAGSTLYVFVEGTSADFRPSIILRDFGGKPLEAANLDLTGLQAALQHTLTEAATGYVIEVAGQTGADDPAADQSYRLLVGLNAPDVLTGTAEAQGAPILKEPIIVSTGIRLNRISGVNSKEESFTMLGSIRMNWTDPAYAFSPDECNCSVKVYTGEDFRNFLTEINSRWPEFSIFNQLGQRFSQSRTAAIWSDGRASYVEEFTATLQADFDFRQFPFDTQSFPVYMDMLFAEDTYVMDVLPDYSAISTEHGEDEFIITDFTTTISPVSGVTGSQVSRFTFEFSAPRHLDYYIFQIFVPILLIALISWFTFFLRDYNRRIEAAAANVLLFIAFSFSLSDNYPRLGYLTFLDAVMIVAFIINTAVILYNVYLKQLESRGQEARAEQIDRTLDWVYPISYVVAIGLVVWLFLGRA